MSTHALQLFRRRDPIDLLYSIIVTVVLVSFALICLLPVIQVVGLSVSTRIEMTQEGVFLWPKQPTAAAYGTVFSSRLVIRGVFNSAIITVFGTLINLFLTSTFSYVLSKKRVNGVSFLNFLVVVSMLFPPGLVPLYLVVRGLGMLNTYWAMMIPLGINAYYCILMRNFFEHLPEELYECAYMEGAREAQVYFYIALPLSKAGLAAFSLFYAVLNWNAFFHALLFISKQELWPIQIFLRNMIDNSYLQGFSSEGAGLIAVAPKAVQMAVVVVAMVPILLLYPFLQKHFAKGVLLGSVKG